MGSKRGSAREMSKSLKKTVTSATFSLKTRVFRGLGSSERVAK